MQTIVSNRFLRILAPLILGALGGFAYWHFVGCASGSCPITSRWWTSTGYGLLVGAAFLLPGKKNPKPDSESNDTLQQP